MLHGDICGICRRDPEPLLNLPINQLRDVLKKMSPKVLRVLKTNKAPVVLDKQFRIKTKALFRFRFRDN